MYIDIRLECSVASEKYPKITIHPWIKSEVYSKCEAMFWKWETSGCSRDITVSVKRTTDCLNISESTIKCTSSEARRSGEQFESQKKLGKVRLKIELEDYLKVFIDIKCTRTILKRTSQQLINCTISRKQMSLNSPLLVSHLCSNLVWWNQ